MTARRKQEAVLRVLRGEPLETVARELRVTAADLSRYRDNFLEGGAASLKSRPRDDRDARIAQLQAKLGEAARAVGVSDRALQLAFGTVKGEAPRTTLAAIRLDAARSRLMAEADAETVTTVALDCGLTHLGRFALAYRARFGESPSVTLQRARGV